MNVKQKTAAVSTLLNLLLTVFKFILASMSGSLVILAEAWHSLTDVGTSLLVYFSVSPGARHPRFIPPEKPETVDGPPLRGKGAAWKNLTREKWISLIIGCVILAAAGGVIHKVFYAPAPNIASPFIYGLVFLLFAFCSLIVSIFEIRIGKRENSPGLIADGLHSKADMVGSLIAGGTMIALQLGIDQLGINIDKIGAVIVIVFVVSFSLETFVNFWWSLHGRAGWQDRVAVGMLAAALDTRTWNRIRRGVGQAINWDQLPAEARGRFRRLSLFVAGLGVLILLLLNSLVVIGPAAEGIRERLGKVINRGAPLGPGLHLKLPWPGEKIIIVDSRSIRRMTIGNTADPRAVALLWTKEHGTDEAFLSAENYFFYPYLVIHYRIKNIFDYAYSFRMPEELLNNATDRLITEIFSGNVFTEIATAYRSPMERRIKEQVQEKLDGLKTGLEIVAVNIIDIHPPVSVADSYEQVIAAMQEKEEKINQALGYRNSSIPEARGWAVKTAMLAKSYVMDKKENAAGEASRFTDRAAAIQDYASIAKPMLHREAVKEALAGKQIVLVDPAVGTPDIWLKNGKPVFLDSQF
ncbi:MAG: SPFH domain-containing protein [PVC group bacterium]